MATGPAPSGDPFVAELVQAVEQRTGLDRPQLALKLDQALQYFDEAAIFTIHGFCQRALADASFSAGLPFSLELVTDDSEMALEAVHDFWRRRVADDSCSAGARRLPAGEEGHPREVREAPEAQPRQAAGEEPVAGGHSMRRRRRSTRRR